MIEARQTPRLEAESLQSAGLHPVLARVYAARGVTAAEAIDPKLEHLLSPFLMKGIERAAALLHQAIGQQQRLCVIADYDCDGATACAVAVRGLRMMGAVVDYLVPNRREHGYGLTAPIVDLARRHPRLGTPHLLITVDNGIASHDGIEAAHAAGMRELVTDHHLPGDTLPAAASIVNPNQPGCDFPSKHLAGVGVMFYLLIALRAAFRRQSPDSPAARAPVQHLLDLVALGTIADLVKLDDNNRRLVAAGLRRIRSGQACLGVRALLTQAGREPRRALATDLGFSVGPRINAAGRLADISLGIVCLLADDPAEADSAASRLDAINRERRDIEQTMREEAISDLGDTVPSGCSVVAFRDTWHEGVVGLVAGQLKTRFGRPSFAFAPAADRIWARGSGRSVPGIHLRDALDLISKRAPGLIERFGGHAMAAGLTLRADAIALFAQTLEQVLLETADAACFNPALLTDGDLDPGVADDSLLDALEAQVWGQGFPEPLFTCEVEVIGQRIVGERHLKLDLAHGGQRYAAIAFGRTDPLPARSQIAYRLTRNEYRGSRTLQLVVEAVTPL